MIYFDNSATTFFKPPEVIGAAVSAMKYLSVNPGRAAHYMALKGARLIYSAREKTARFFGCGDASRVIFTSGCTAALNLAVMGSNLLGKHVVTTALEHNSVLRPLFELKRRGDISLSVVPPSQNGVVTVQAIAGAVRKNTAMVITTHISNVIGTVQPIAEIGSFCRKNDIVYLVDAAQSAGMEHIDVEKFNIDMLAAPAHKGLHAITGAGVLVMGERASVMPVTFGGTGTDSDNLMQPISFPDGYEAGTINLPAVAALARAEDLCIARFETRRNTVLSLCSYLYDKLSQMPEIKIYSPRYSPGGIIAFNIRGFDSESVAEYLSEKYSICLRSGLHCAPLAHRFLGTSSRGIVRASLSFDNTKAEIDIFADAVKHIIMQNGIKADFR